MAEEITPFYGYCQSITCVGRWTMWESLRVVNCSGCRCWSQVPQIGPNQNVMGMMRKFGTELIKCYWPLYEFGFLLSQRTCPGCRTPATWVRTSVSQWPSPVWSICNVANVAVIDFWSSSVSRKKILYYWTVTLIRFSSFSLPVHQEYSSAIAARPYLLLGLCLPIVMQIINS